jgi:hypothetical protein
MRTDSSVDIEGYGGVHMVGTDSFSKRGWSGSVYRSELYLFNSILTKILRPFWVCELCRQVHKAKRLTSEKTPLMKSGIAPRTTLEKK